MVLSPLVRQKSIASQSDPRMALAINIRSDDSSAERIEALWDEVAAFESQPSMRLLGYRPHFTFAIYDARDYRQDRVGRFALLEPTSRSSMRPADDHLCTLPMMPVCPCFARRSKKNSEKSQAIDPTEVGYCAWGCFRVFDRAEARPQSVYALRASPDTLRYCWAWLGHAKPFGEAWWAHKGSNLGPLPCEGNALPLSYAPGTTCRRPQP